MDLDTTGLASLAVAFVLSSVIGFERELRQKSAGLRTHTLVGVGAALFTLAGWYGFGGRSLGTDATRIASQVVTGIGFIGAGVIFMRRDGVRGLTTAAAIWLTAAVGLAAGAGLWLLATAATAIHLVVSFVYTPLVRRLPASQYSLTTFEVSYHDGQGILRNVLSATTDLGYVVSNLDVARADERRDVVTVTLDAEGRRRPEELIEALQQVGGVIDVRATGSPE
ncbi:MAG TPA: MgtC/SapB family protein [Actinomycetota bacterium]